MAFEFRLPDIGEGVVEGELTKWMVAEGQQVAEDTPLFEVLTDKVSGPALLVDDVATSGSHIEEAVKLLRPACGSVLAVAWIGA